MSSFSRSSSSEGNASYRNPKTVMQIQKTHSFLWLLSGKMECQSIPKIFIVTRSTKILDRLAGIYGAWLKSDDLWTTKTHVGDIWLTVKIIGKKQEKKTIHWVSSKISQITRKSPPLNPSASIFSSSNTTTFFWPIVESVSCVGSHELGDPCSTPVFF